MTPETLASDAYCRRRRRTDYGRGIARARSATSAATRAGAPAGSPAATRSTSAVPTTTPSAIAANRAASAGVRMPKPTATGAAAAVADRGEPRRIDGRGGARAGHAGQRDVVDERRVRARRAARCARASRSARPAGSRRRRARRAASASSASSSIGRSTVSTASTPAARGARGERARRPSRRSGCSSRTARSASRCRGGAARRPRRARRARLPPAASARSIARWIDGPSADGSENGTPSSITSAPARHAASTTVDRRLPDPDRRTSGTRRARRAARRRARRTLRAAGSRLLLRAARSWPCPCRRGRTARRRSTARPAARATSSSAAIACAVSSAHRMPSVRASRSSAASASSSVRDDVGRARRSPSSTRARGRRPDSRGPALIECACAIWPSSSHEHVALAAVQHADAAGAERRGVAAGRDALARRLDAEELHAGVADERREQARRVRAAADARDQRVGQPAGLREDLRARLAADHATADRAPSTDTGAGRRPSRSDRTCRRRWSPSRAAPRSSRP